MFGTWSYNSDLAFLDCIFNRFFYVVCFVVVLWCEKSSVDLGEESVEINAPFSATLRNITASALYSS